MFTHSLRFAFTDLVATGFLGAIAEEVAPTGLSLTLLTSADDGDIVPARDVAMDGALLYSCDWSSKAVDFLHRRRLPLVYVDQDPADDYPSVNVDDRGGARAAARHLLDLGHRRIGFVAGPGRFRPTREKEMGREIALDAAGISPNGLVAHADFGVEGGRTAMGALLDKDEPPTAVICSSDLMAIGALREATARGLRVPADVSIVGFDGIEAAAWIDPPLTTVEQPILDIARTAVSTLLGLIGGQSGAMPDVQYRPKLRVGGSTARA
jgi:DNA-binding LacI/PurR family transcriptional regulator